MKRTFLTVAVVVVTATPVAAFGQQVGSRVGSGFAAASGYEDGNRRDPFVSLVQSKKGPALAPQLKGVSGLAGISINDVVVRGIVRSGTLVMATLEGPEGKQFLARKQDKLQDGVIKSIDKDGVVFVERSVDAIGNAHTHEVRKPLHLAEGAR